MLGKKEETSMSSQDVFAVAYDEPSEPVLIARETERLLRALMQRPASDFIAGDLAWLIAFKNHTRFASDVRAERKYQETVKKILATCDERSSSQPGELT